MGDRPALDRLIDAARMGELDARHHLSLAGGAGLVLRFRKETPDWLVDSVNDALTIDYLVVTNDWTSYPERIHAAITDQDALVFAAIAEGHSEMDPSAVAHLSEQRQAPSL